MGVIADEMRKTILESRRNYAELLATTAELVVAHEKNLDAAANNLIVLPPQIWTIQKMKQDFPQFSRARSHFRKLYGVKATSWQHLVDRVNTIEMALVHLGFAYRTESSSRQVAITTYSESLP